MKCAMLFRLQSADERKLSELILHDVRNLFRLKKKKEEEEEEALLFSEH
jgi:hypothetical protein